MKDDRSSQSLESLPRCSRMREISFLPRPQLHLCLFFLLVATPSMRLLFGVIAGAAVCKMMLIPSAELLKQQKSHLLKFKELKIVTERTLHNEGASVSEMQTEIQIESM